MRFEESNDHINFETLKTGEDIISMTLVKMYINAYQKDEYPPRGRTLRW